MAAMSGETPGRRARYRAETREEAKAIALRQLAEGGSGTVSLNAIAREMGVTGPALYRYFDSRDALLTALIVDAYHDLAVVVETIARNGAEGAPRERLTALAAAVRDWALAQPHRYLLIYGTPVPGYVAPDATTDLARRVLAPFLDAIAALGVQEAQPGSRRAALEAQLGTWAAATEQQVTAPVLRRGLLWWTRLQGLLSLEVAGHFTTMGFDPALLFATEVEALLEDMQR